MKQRRKKSTISVADLLKDVSRKDILSIKHKVSVSTASATEADQKIIENLKLKSGYYSLRTRILKNSWVNSRPANQATKWLFKEVFQNPANYRYTRRLLYQGGLFTFEYLNPKYKGTSVLPWFDKYPLVVSLGPIVTNQGVRNLGFNLHLLPPKIRIIAICAIFEMYKKLYRYQIFYRKTGPVNIKYQYIIRSLKVYGIKFAVRMYIPNRMNKIAVFGVKDWHKAIFLPSRGYDSIKAEKLIKEWKLYCRENSYGATENMDWKSII